MSDRRFFVPHLGQLDTLVPLDEAVVKHMRVLRMRPGARCVLFDGHGGEADVELVQLDEETGACRVLAVRGSPAVARMVLVQCLPKGSKIETSVRMATELGVSAIHPAVSERSVARPDAKRVMAKHDRLTRIAKEASRQAQRASVPAVHAPAPLTEVIARAPETARKLVFWEESKDPLDRVHASWSEVSEVWIVVGPEGGLSEKEVATMRSRGFGVAGLGATVLRVETAIPVVLALIADRLGLLQHRAS